MNYESRKLYVIQRATGDLPTSLPNFSKHYETIANIKQILVTLGNLQLCAKLNAIEETLKYMDNFRNEMAGHKEHLLPQIVDEFNEVYFSKKV